MHNLTKISIEGFKSIREEELELGPINVLIGANAAGKSNFISAFKMLNFISTDNLQLWVARNGFANSILYYGSKRMQHIKMCFTFTSDGTGDDYEFHLSQAEPDTLVFVKENLEYWDGKSKKPKVVRLEVPGKETKLNDAADKRKQKEARIFRNILRGLQVFQFHDTSEEARIRNTGDINDNRFLYKDAGNLAAYLYLLKEKQAKAYERIVSTIRLAAPEFDDFDLQPLELNPDRIMLQWREKGGEYLFGPHQLADGLLRFMALTTLLLQPRKKQPAIIVIDEPELGLHPVAIDLLAGMIREVSQERQVILATQSLTFVEKFKPEEILVVERKPENNGREYATRIKRFGREELRSWLDDYTIGELWEKNVLGGRP